MDACYLLSAGQSLDLSQDRVDGHALDSDCSSADMQKGVCIERAHSGVNLTGHQQQSLCKSS